jgi:hypothetical protein
VLLVLGGGIAYPMTHTINAEDVEAEIPPELELAERSRRTRVSTARTARLHEGRRGQARGAHRPTGGQRRTSRVV